MEVDTYALYGSEVGSGKTGGREKKERREVQRGKDGGLKVKQGQR